MIRSITWTTAALVVVMLASGCVSVPKDASFADVRQTVAERTGQRIQWNQSPQDEQAVAAAVHEMLSQALSADGAVQIALLNNQSLQATFEELGIAQAELVEAGLLRNPTIGAEVRFPKHAALPFEIDVSQSLIDLLLLPVRKRAAGAAFDAVKLRVTADVLNTAADTKTAFYRAQAAEQLVEMRRTIVAATEASHEAARRLHDAGNITDLALANERALYEQAKTDLRRAEGDSADAREELNALMGVWGADTAWSLTPRLPELPQTEIAETGLESLAVSQRADLGAARQDVEAAAQGLGMTKSTAMVSDLNLTGHLERDADGTMTVGPGISLPLPIFNQGQAAVAAAEARFRQSQRKFAALAVQIRSQVRRARSKMIAARERADYFARVILPLRHQIVQQNQLQFNAMQIGIFELLQAKQAEIDAGREYVEALRDYWTARVELERAVGGQLEASAPATQPAQSGQPPETQPAAHEHHHHGA